jgi:3-hydroxyacyl-[acyl-carrier-protein] dehydratase
MRTLREEIMACTDGQVRALEADGGQELVFRFGKDFIGFAGHFPGHPVLPAFVQLLTAQCALQIHSARNWTLRCVARSKFLKTILPEEPVTVRWQEQAKGEDLRCSFTLLVNDQRAAVFTVDFASEESSHA